MKRSSILLKFCLFALICLFSAPAYGEETVPTSIHIHSTFSSGARSLSEIADLAKKQNVEALIFTDHYNEKYEYGFWFLKRVYQRPSVAEIGVIQYLESIERAAKSHPELILIDGTAVTPYYYWSGNVWPGPLILKNRAKDLLVLGLGDADHYLHLPVVQNKRLGFSPYQEDAYSEPYQRFIEEVIDEGGLVFWSHPLASEKLRFENVFLSLDIILHTKPYMDALLETQRYTGFGVFSSELAQVNTAAETTISIDGMWDKILRQHCRGQREPAYIIGEVDYNGKPNGIQNLDEILTMVIVPKKSKEDILKSIAGGKSYLIIPQNHEKHLILEEFAVFDRTSEKKGEMGKALNIKGIPVIRIKVKYSDGSSGAMQFLLLRNGRKIEHWNKTVPFTLEHEDPENTEPGKSYYRVIAYSEETPDRLLTNPVFVNRKL
jgi:hypothetical protein